MPMIRMEGRLLDDLGGRIDDPRVLLQQQPITYPQGSSRFEAQGYKSELEEEGNDLNLTFKLLIETNRSAGPLTSGSVRDKVK